VEANTKRRRRTAFGVSCVSFAFTLTLCFVVLRTRSNQPRYEGRTIEEWLRTPNWPAEKRRVELAILAGFGQKSVPVLQELLLKKGTRQELALWEKVPIVRDLYGRRVTRAELKERILTCLGSLEEIGQQCVPAVLELAENQNETPRIRQLAIYALSATCLYNETAKAELARLRNDPVVAAQASRAFFQMQRNEEAHRADRVLHEVREEMELRARSHDPASLTTTEFLTRTSLWEKARPGLDFGRQ
jgi:hypothetical protein